MTGRHSNVGSIDAPASTRVVLDESDLYTPQCTLSSSSASQPFVNPATEIDVAAVDADTGEVLPRTRKGRRARKRLQAKVLKAGGAGLDDPAAPVADFEHGLASLLSAIRHTPLGRFRSELVKARANAYRNIPPVGESSARPGAEQVDDRPLLPSHLPLQPPEINRSRRRGRRGPISKRLRARRIAWELAETQCALFSYWALGLP